MPYQVEWADDVLPIVRVILLIDPVMGSEITAAADLLAANPIAHGSRAVRLGYSGMQYSFRVRDGIVVTLTYHFKPGGRTVVIRRISLGR